MVNLQTIYSPLIERSEPHAGAGASSAKGWVPLLKHEKALVINTTLFREEDYKADWEAPMTRIIDDWGLRYPGIKKVEHVYFYNVPMADEQTRSRYLWRAYTLGKEFSLS